MGTIGVTIRLIGMVRAHFGGNLSSWLCHHVITGEIRGCLLRLLSTWSTNDTSLTAGSPWLRSPVFRTNQDLLCKTHEREDRANLLPGLGLQCREEVRPIYHPDKAGDRDSAQIFPNLETHQQPASQPLRLKPSELCFCSAENKTEESHSDTRSSYNPIIFHFFLHILTNFQDIWLLNWKLSLTRDVIKIVEIVQQIWDLP